MARALTADVEVQLWGSKPDGTFSKDITIIRPGTQEDSFRLVAGAAGLGQDVKPITCRDLGSVDGVPTADSQGPMLTVSDLFQSCKEWMADETAQMAAQPTRIAVTETHRRAHLSVKVLPPATEPHTAARNVGVGRARVTPAASDDSDDSLSTRLKRSRRATAEWQKYTHAEVLPAVTPCINLQGKWVLMSAIDAERSGKARRYAAMRAAGIKQVVDTFGVTSTEVNSYFKRKISNTSDIIKKGRPGVNPGVADALQEWKAKKGPVYSLWHQEAEPSAQQLQALLPAPPDDAALAQQVHSKASGSKGRSGAGKWAAKPCGKFHISGGSDASAAGSNRAHCGGVPVRRASGSGAQQGGNRRPDEDGVSEVEAVVLPLNMEEERTAPEEQQPDLEAEMERMGLVAATAAGVAANMPTPDNHKRWRDARKAGITITRPTPELKPRRKRQRQQAQGRPEGDQEEDEAEEDEGEEEEEEEVKPRRLQRLRKSTAAGAAAAVQHRRLHAVAEAFKAPALAAAAKPGAQHSSIRAAFIRKHGR